MSACSTKTFVDLTIEGGVNLPEIKSIEIDLQLGSNQASTVLTEKDGTAITLPTSVVLELRNGEGDLTITAIAKSASGAEVTRGTIQTSVKRGKTTSATLQLGGQAPPDGGTPDGGNLISVAPSDVTFGSVLLGASSTSGTVTVTNTGSASSGELTLTVTNGVFALSDDLCSGQTLAGGATCTFRVTFTPTATGVVNGSIAISSTAAGADTVTLAGTGLQPGALTLDQDAFDFGAVVQAMPSAAKTFTVTNTGGATSGTITTSLSGSAAAQFAISNDQCNGKTLDASKTCTIDVTFTPAGLGPVSGVTLTVDDGAGGDSLALSGTGVKAGALGIGGDPAFGIVDLPGKLARDFTVTNNGGSPIGPLVVSSDNSQFAVDGTTTCVGATVAVGMSCTQRVTFQPSAYGNKTAVLTIGPAAGGGGATANLTGTGRDSVMLSASTTGTGTGTITGGGLNCGDGNVTCSVSVTRAATAPTVTVTAKANVSSSTFSSWSGDCTSAGSATTCMVSMSPGSRSISANFNTAPTVLLVVTKTTAKGGTGKVTTADSKIDCGSTCATSYAQSASNMVTLTAVPDAGMGVVWGGDCAAQKMATTCTVAMGMARNVSALFRPAHNFMFLSSASYNGKLTSGALTGVLAGDALCQKLADNAALPGKYMAWLADEANNQTPTQRFQAVNPTVRGWVRSDGSAFGDFPANLYSGVTNPPDMTETGTVNSGAQAYTGVYFGAIQTGLTCTSWTSNASSPALIGYAGATNNQWAGAVNITTGCDGSSIYNIYCFEVDYSNAP